MTCSMIRSECTLPEYDSVMSNVVLDSVDIFTDHIDLNFTWPHTYDYVKVLVFKGAELISVSKHGWAPGAVTIPLDSADLYKISYRYESVDFHSDWDHAIVAFTADETGDVEAVTKDGIFVVMNGGLVVHTRVEQYFLTQGGDTLITQDGFTLSL